MELEEARQALARVHDRRRAIEMSVARVEEYGKLPALGREFVETVLAELHALPKPRPLLTQFTQDRSAVAASDAHLRTLRALGLFGRAAAAPETAAPASDALRTALARQHELLTQLDPLQRDLVKALHERSAAERDFERWSEDAAAHLTRLLYWVPVRPGWAIVTELDSAVAWTLSPANWARAFDALRAGAHRSPVTTIVAVLLAAGLLAARRRLRRMLAATAPAERPGGSDGLVHALAALGLTLALALPLPLALYAAGALMHPLAGADAFTVSLHLTLVATAKLLFALSALAWALDPQGLAIRHFAWNAAALGYASGVVRRFSAMFVPVLAIGALNGMDSAPFVNRESLSRLALILAMVLALRLLVRLFGSHSFPMREMRAQGPRSWLVRFHGLWFTALVAIPAGILALVVAGYFVAAAFILGRIVTSLFLVLAAAALYGFMGIWVRQLRERLLTHRSTGAAVPGAIAPPQRISDDIGAITERTRSLLDLAVTVLLVGGMWLIWRDVLPALAEIGDYVLWTHEATENGKTVNLPLTLGDVFLAAVTAGVTFVVVRNIGALLDVVLLKRLELQQDASFAIKVTARYLAAMIGVVIAARTLGISWNDVQWLVAALSVGLGFGLQEIVANFVAGLIVLVERPVRLGDVVTIGDVSGTVARIQARVLTLVDFDNKEVLIPNKSLITDRVINWTLSSQTTRLVLKVDLSGDTDLALAQRVILEAVQGNPDVLPDPGPRVFVIAFRSGGGLTLEINAFVGSFDKRQRVQHEINVAVDEALRRHGIRAT